jgi:hypothetical protein
MSARYVFVGERRSNRAIAMGVTWENGRLAACTLHDALSAAGIEPSTQVYVNAWQDDGAVNLDGIQLASVLQIQGWVVVALGQKAQRHLTRIGLEHVALVHPAARGAIRLKSAYRQHVAEQLASRAVAS